MEIIHRETISYSVSLVLFMVLVSFLCKTVFFFRPREITYPDDFIDLLKKEVVDVSRALSTSYWFDDEDDKNDRIDITDTWDEDEYELVPQSKGKNFLSNIHCFRSMKMNIFQMIW